MSSPFILSAPCAAFPETRLFKVTLFFCQYSGLLIVLGLFIDKQVFHSVEHGLLYKDLRTGSDLWGHTSFERNNSIFRSLAVKRCRSHAADVLYHSTTREKNVKQKKCGDNFIFSQSLGLAGF